jgi:hypothetical protein
MRMGIAMVIIRPFSAVVKALRGADPNAGHTCKQATHAGARSTRTALRPSLGSARAGCVRALSTSVLST